MTTRGLILIFGIAAAVLAGYADNLAGIYVSVFGTFIIYLLHTMEVKLNKLLDHYGITVWQSDIDKD